MLDETSWNAGDFQASHFTWCISTIGFVVIPRFASILGDTETTLGAPWFLVRGLKILVDDLGCIFIGSEKMQRNNTL